MSKKIALITGATKGIGEAITKKLLHENNNYFVIGIARNPPSWEHENFQFVSMNLQDISSLPQKLKELKKQIPTPDILVANAGKGLLGNLEELSFVKMKELMDLNFLSQAYLIKNFLPEMKKRKAGEIILLCSKSGLKGSKKGSLYCASKFALRGFGQALKEECCNDGIRVTMIHPGIVATPFFKDLPIKPTGNKEEQIEPKDVADVVELVIKMRKGTLLDEITLSPQRNNFFKN